MWWRDQSSRTRAAAVLVVLAMAGTVAGCQVRPLYAARPGGVDVVPEMRRIAVETQRDRVAQEIMNQLIFSLRGGAALVDPAYTLRLIVATRRSELAIQVREEVPTAYLITVTTTYSLTENGTGRVLANETIYTTASYDFSSQRFANLRAERDAENRAARAAADDIRMRIAAMFAAAAPSAGL